MRAPGSFRASANTVDFSGSPDDWGYRRLVLHYAHLAQAAGGVDAFLIGSRAARADQLRDEDDAFPLRRGAVRRWPAMCARCSGRRPRSPMAPTGANISATSRRRYRRRALPSRSAVGASRYRCRRHRQLHAAVRLARCATMRRGNPDGFAGPYDPAGLRRRSPAARASTGIMRRSRRGGCASARRSPTAPTASPGSFATRISTSWWAQPHYNRIGGAEADEPTAWVPAEQAVLVHRARLPGDRQGAEPAQRLFRSEIGGECAALFLERRALRSRAAAVSRRRITATGIRRMKISRRRTIRSRPSMAGAWSTRSASMSGLGTRGPFRPFPLRGDRWSDHGNWHYGHWLNGRLGNPDGRRTDQRDPRRPRAADCGCRRRGWHGPRLCHRRAGLGALCNRAADRAVRSSCSREPGRAGVPRRSAGGIAGCRSPRWSRTAATQSSRRCGRPITNLPVGGGAEFSRSAGRVSGDLRPARKDRRAGQPPARDRISRLAGGGAGQGAASATGCGASGTSASSVAFAVDAAERRHRARRAGAPAGSRRRLARHRDRGRAGAEGVGAAGRARSAHVWQSANPGAVSAVSLVVGQPLALFLDLPMGAGPGSAGGSVQDRGLAETVEEPGRFCLAGRIPASCSARRSASRPISAC